LPSAWPGTVSPLALGVSSDATHITVGARRKRMPGNLVKVSTNVTGATFGSPFMIPPNAP
jgi:hypothetical protein